MKFTMKPQGSALVVALSSILILSITAAGVLMNCTTRYNATSTQVKGWKEALQAAESGGDVAFAEVRKTISDTATPFPSPWSSPAPSPASSSASWSLGYGSTFSFGANNNLRAKVVVDRFAMLPGSTTAGYYRIRSIGTAEVTGLKRTGMDNRMNGTTRGDTLLRRIDFNFDHFLATYGYGDAQSSATPTTANGKQISAVANANKPQVTRRVELVATPIMPIEAAIKTSGALAGPGSAGVVDSYDSNNLPKGGTSPSSSYYGSNPVGADAAYAVDAHDGDVACGNSAFSQGGFIYGDVSTNGGAASTARASGVVDNNVAFTIPPATPGTAPIPTLPPSTSESGSPSTINPPTRITSAGKLQTEFWYIYGEASGTTINPIKATVSGVANTPIETTVNIYATGDVDGITVNKGVIANIYFRGNISCKARDIDNLNADGPGGNGVYVPDTYAGSGSTATVATYKASSTVSRAGHLWFYGISPTDGTPRTIDIGPPGTVWAAFYAPGHDFTTRGNPDFYSVMVVKTLHMNGNNSFHYDKQLAAGTKPLDYRIASYVEDIR